jgi:hypothetical protein
MKIGVFGENFKGRPYKLKSGEGLFYRSMRRDAV